MWVVRLSSQFRCSQALKIDTNSSSPTRIKILEIEEREGGRRKGEERERGGEGKKSERETHTHRATIEVLRYM